MTDSRTEARVFAGLSRVRYEGAPFDLGFGVTISHTYAHLFAAPMMAFARAEPGDHHPPPWRAADGGGYAHDIEVELSAPSEGTFPCDLSAERVIGLIASLLRLRQMQLTVPVLSNVAFAEAATSDRVPELMPFETGIRIVSFANRSLEVIGEEQLQWVRDVWPNAAKLVSKHKAFDAALSAADNCTIEGRAASSLLLAWGALEGLFAIGSRSEVRYRVSANIASYNEPYGPARRELFRRAKRLYDARSSVAHSANDADVGDLLESFIILRNSITKILIRGDAPSHELLEKLAFGFEPPDRGG